MIPLYQLGQDKQWRDLIESDSAHSGLLYDKFINIWQNYQERFDDEAKGEYFKAIIKHTEQSSEILKKGLETAQEKHQNLILAQAGQTLILETEWRLIVGMGNAHPLEAGFTWHPTLGVPYLPGTSIKGLLREWISKWTKGGPEEANRLLGAESDNNMNHSGAVIIFDAIPRTPPTLEIDILTPHYQPYYTEPETAQPADYYNPVPVKFLTIAPGQEFTFSIAPRNNNATDEDIDNCQQYLISAINTLGIGGKTAVGYGLMKKSQKAQFELEQKRQAIEQRIELEKMLKQTQEEFEASGLPEEFREMFVQKNEEDWSTNNVKFYAGADHWVPIIEVHEDAGTRKQAAQTLMDILEGMFKGIKDDPKRKTGKKKNKAAYKPSPIKIATNLNKILNQ